jgi:hypothetical protein
MLQQFIFFASIVFSFIAWGVVTVRYIWDQAARNRTSMLSVAAATGATTTGDPKRCLT